MFELYLLNNWNDDAILAPWEIIKMVITHKEGHVAKASLTVAKFSTTEALFLAIFEDKQLLFKGMISGQFEHHNNLTTVEVLGINPSFDNDLKETLKNLEYNPLFFQGVQAKASDRLETCNDLFYWDRTTGKLSLSNYFKGKRHVNIGGNYLDKSLKINQINMPLGKVIVHLNVMWTQSLEGCFNAAPYISRAFPNGVIATLTPNSLAWPKTDQRLGSGMRQSGYRVSSSSFKLTNTSLSSNTFHTKEGEIRLKIHHFKGDLKINWQYEQLREERLTLQGILNHKQHLFTKHKIRHIPITVHLPKSEQAMFFETISGKDFIAYARNIASSQLKASARCMRVVCKVPWNLARDLTVDDSVSLTNQITGKVTMVRLVVNGMQRFVELTLGCTIASGDLAHEIETIDETIISTDALKGLTFYPNPKDLIEKVEVKNTVAEQEEYLIQNGGNLALAEVPTSIHLTMRDLRTEEALVRNFKMTLLETPS